MHTKGKLEYSVVAENAIDIISKEEESVVIAGIISEEDKLGALEFANAQELVRRWNSQPELLEALLKVNKWLVQNTAAANRPATLDKAILDAIAKAEPTG